MRLTERNFTTDVSINDLIHIVNTGDTTQSPQGSSYKASFKQVLEGLNIIDIIYSELYNSIVNEELIPGQWYRLTDYKSVNFLNGWEISNNNSNYYGNPPTDPNFIPQEIYTGDVEVLLLQAKSTSEIAEIGYSETFKDDIIHYQAYTNKIGVQIKNYNNNTTGVFNGSYLPDDNIVSGFDLQWDGTNVYFEMPSNYPVLYGQPLSLYCEFTSPTIGSANSLLLSGTAAGTGSTYYPNIFASNISSSGYGLSVSIQNTGLGYYNVWYIAFGGLNYSVDDTLLIPGSKVGGIDGVNDIILTVDGIDGNYYQQGIFFTKIGDVKPGISITANNGVFSFPKQTSRIRIENNGQKVVLLDLTIDDYNNYQSDTLFVNTSYAIGDAFGWIMKRQDTLRNVTTPFDFRARTYRRFEVDLSNLNSSLGIGFYGQGDDFAGQGTTGNYRDLKCFENAFNLTWNGLAFGENGFGENDNNVFFGFIVDVTIQNGFANNTLANLYGIFNNDSVIENSSIDNYFRYNTIGGRFRNNVIANGFRMNLIGWGFTNNDIDIDFSTNSIADNFTNNSITNSFNNNYIESGFQRNTVTAALGNQNFAGANRVYQGYFCQIIRREDNDYVLGYVDTNNNMIYTTNLND